MSEKLNMKKEFPKGNKSSLRKHYLSLRKTLSSERRMEASREVAAYLQTRLDSCAMVLSYVPFQDEVDVTLINERLTKRGALALPCVMHHHIEMVMIKDLEHGLHRGKHGFYQPILQKNLLIHSCDVILVPGIAFDRRGNRIGFGFGHYDHFLRGKEKTPKIGIAFREQIVPGVLECDEHDIPMDEMCII